MKKRVFLNPQYVKYFQCISHECEDNCCYGWRVSIDENTYKKYRKVSDKIFKPLLDKNVTRNRSNHSCEYYAKINMGENGYCPFFEEDKLCGIHKKLGAEFLSNVCMVYPRVTNVVNGVYEKSVTLSCPEGARLVLLNPNIMEFDEIKEFTEEQHNIAYRIDTESIQISNNLKKYFWLLRIFSITLLQNRKYSLADRMIILGLCMKKVQEYSDNNRVHEIPALIEEYNQIIENENLKESLGNISANLTIQMELMKEFNDQRFSIAYPQNSKSYVDCVAECLKGIEYTAEAKVEEVGERYKEAYLKYYEPFVSDHEYIFENFLVNNVFKKMFPISSKDGVFDDYIKLVIHYSLIKTLLIGMSAYNKKLDEELIVRLVYSFSRAIEHNIIFFDDTFKMFKENGYNTMAYMTILIRN
ncbi:flagellin lysine-N-methylase [Clostridium estertheticum]|uniref:flagellin lysine-N-methylase n=1 Tax=Clostridium estertheticum TaxID=238834 RepID=UPI001C0D5AE6|nr:flagellin lysine-N-methylase [Clostridium estertheticum]MBU3214278.1 flagellin lysine-N-methylase [Clostridium estertheticum]WAG54707.1 flagellin lysine-N-methylase [Clostridium estertheticum]